MTKAAKVQAGDEDYFTVSANPDGGWNVCGKPGEFGLWTSDPTHAAEQCARLNRAYALGKAAGGGARERRILIELLRHFDGMRPDDITEAHLDAVEAILRREGA